MPGQAAGMPGQAAGEEQQAGVGDAGAAPEVEGRAVGGEAAKAPVRHVLAQEEVDGGEGGQLLAEQARHHVVRQARAPAQVEGGEGGGEGVGAAHQLPEAPWSLAPW